VDLNVIPTQFVERIDILTGGASSLYGSDAVAGVVNFIYKRNFQGWLAEAQAGISEIGDAGSQRISVTGGINFGEDRGNIMVHAGYDREEGLLGRNRERTSVDQLSTFWYFTGDPADYRSSVRPFYSSFAPQGRFNTGDYTFTFGPSGALQPCFTTNGASCNSEILDDDGNVVVPGIGTGVGPNGFNRQAYRTLLTPVERYTAAFNGHFDISDTLRFIAEGTYVRTNASTEIEPFPLDSGGSTGPYRDTAGRAPIESLVNGVILRNPFVPDAIYNNATDNDGDGLRDITFARRLSDLSSRNFTAKRDFYRVVAGFEGDLFNDKWHWDATFNYGHNKERQASNGDVNIVNFRNAFAAVRDPATGAIVCADPAARSAGCVPLNIFGMNTITPEAGAYIDAQTTHAFKMTQKVLAANVNGSLVDLPAGPLALAIGGEWRWENSSEDWDPTTNAGLTAGNQLPDTKGKVEVKEIYGEINVPVLHDQPFGHELNLRAAGRLSDYSTIGTVKTWNVGADYAPIPAIRFRGTYAVAIRAPNIVELFQGAAQTFPTGIVDPCDGVTLTATDQLSVFCRSQPGVVTNINANGGVFTLNQADIQGISGFDSGNPNLKEERAKTLTAGVVINPSTLNNFLRRLILTVDYYRIRIKDAIILPSRSELVDQCYNNQVTELCGSILRRPAASGSNSPGSIEFINLQAINSGVLKTSGIDVTATYRANTDWATAGSSLSFRVAYTHVIDGYQIAFPAFPVKDRFAGEIGTSKDRANATVAWDSDLLTLSFTGTYIGKAREDDRSLASSVGLEPDAIKIPSEFYLDTQLRVRPDPKFEIFFGVDNVLDNKPPLIYQGSVFNTTGHITAADVYDDIGRRFYLGARVKFAGAQGQR
jgi:outer membrane receptor protein involved in Fe transport